MIVFDKNGKFIRAWGKVGQGQGEFSQPHSIALDSKGRVYVADRNNSRIQIFDSKGRFLTEWKNIITPWAIAITKTDEIYVCGSSPTLWSEIPASQTALATPPKDELFMKLDTEGRLKQLWVVPKGDKPGELNWAHSIAVAPDGSIYFGAEVHGRSARAEIPVPAGTLGQTNPEFDSIGHTASSRVFSGMLYEGKFMTNSRREFLKIASAGAACARALVFRLCPNPRWA